jgi:hypothetical protein
MALAQGLTTSFKEGMLQGIHNLATDTLNIALYTSDASLNAATTVYTTAGEVSGGSYVAGGIALTGATITADNGVVCVDFADALWDPAGFTARGALIYNVSKSNASIAVLDFGMDRVGPTTFTVKFPAASSTTALMRF